MKYCKKCFRNVREDVSVCPYCGAPGLTEYGSQNSGEDFTCSQPKALEREIEQNIEELQPKKADAYTCKNDDDNDSIFNMFGDEDENPYNNGNSTDPYGSRSGSSDCNEPEFDAYGSKRHSDDNCENAPDTPKNGFTDVIPNPDDPKIKMRIEYLNMLKKINGITPQRIEELMRRYDETHGNYTGSFTVTRKAVSTGQNTTVNSTAIIYIIAMFFALIFGFTSPLFGIIIMFAIKGKLKKLDLPDKNRWDKIMNIFILIFVIILIGYGLIAVLSFVAGGGALISV